LRENVGKPSDMCLLKVDTSSDARIDSTASSGVEAQSVARTVTVRPAWTKAPIHGAWPAANASYMALYHPYNATWPVTSWRLPGNSVSRKASAVGA